MRAVVVLPVSACVLLATFGFAAAPGVSSPEDLVIPGEEGGAESTDEQDGIAVGDTGASLTWSTTTIGTRAVRLTISYGSSQTCTLKATGSATTSTTPWLLYFGHDAVGRVWQAVEVEDLVSGMSTHGHVGNFAVTEGQPNGSWVATITLGVTASGTQSFLAAGWNLRPALGNPTSLKLTVTCASAVTVTALESGTVAHGWKPYTMRGGAGHTTGIGIDTTTDVADTTGLVGVSTSIGHLRLRSEDNAAVGQARIETPSGPINTVLAGDDDVLYTGTNGAYRATVTRTGVGEDQKTILLLVGTDPVLAL